MAVRLLLGSLLLALAGLCSFFGLGDLRDAWSGISGAPAMTDAVFMAVWWLLSAAALMAAVYEFSRGRE